MSFDLTQPSSSKHPYTTYTPHHVPMTPPESSGCTIVPVDATPTQLATRSRRTTKTKKKKQQQRSMSSDGSDCEMVVTMDAGDGDGLSDSDMDAASGSGMDSQQESGEEEELESEEEEEEEEEEAERMVVLRDAFLGEGEEEQSMYDGGSMLAEGTSPARETEAALVELSSSISSGLTQYRDQFCSWEQLQAHSLPSSSSQLASVVKASSRIDQGFARFVFVMEPFKSLSDRFAALASSLHHLGSYLDQSHRFELDTQLWSRLCELEDQTMLVGSSFKSGMGEVEELHDWLDGVLTPALAEVRIQTGSSSMVHEILDVHSYLCDSLVKIMSILSIYHAGIQRIHKLVHTLQQTFSLPPRHLNHVASWSMNTAVSLLSASSGLAILSSISACLQFHSQGGLSASSDHPHGISY
ncbi:hypothetical protein PCASD_24386 [Puccinia coronata f. sp. avenae]|uniref:Uncharacterized protein n=1 Tax=Puccinia coronata f. sp. avenae TaxID=200324 RepID=A0A2N5TQG6_9BASI|nr:hypothetical protein PCASD_24386 [Puccinia coronata f. sp. avenae]